MHAFILVRLASVVHVHLNHMLHLVLKRGMPVHPTLVSVASMLKDLRSGGTPNASVYTICFHDQSAAGDHGYE